MALGLKNNFSNHISSILSRFSMWCVRYAIATMFFHLSVWNGCALLSYGAC